MAKENDHNKKSDVAKREEEILRFWQENGIFKKSEEKSSPKGEFVFYDGPPFATGLPHHGSLLSSIIKDVIPRYQTMRGYRVRRRWGWDCHGLPIESLVEKQLGLKTKKDIDAIGIAAFNRAARESVLQFADDWEQYVDRVGRWVDFAHSYKTMDNEYIESVWWGLSLLNKEGLLYEGRKVLMYCPHCETPLAKAEIAMDQTYQDVTDEAVTVKFHLKPGQEFGNGKYKTKDTAYLLAWTTTPWTLPGNVAVAVGKDIRYTSLRVDGAKELLIVASDLVDTLFKGRDVEIVHDDMIGEDLVGLEYEPLFHVPETETETSHRVYPADFVSTEEGTGIVHTAVMYGEDDFTLGKEENLPMVELLDEGAHYTDRAPEFLRGTFIKSSESAIIEDLERRNLLFEKRPHTHSYPHCYRCGAALIYNAVSSWFIAIQKVKDELLKKNEEINWVPGYLKEGRFKNIVESAPDWTISRNRYWASPLPIWKDEGGDLTVIGSLNELKDRTKKSGNRYFVMRHGESESNRRGLISSFENNPHPLTEKGKEGVREAAQRIKNEGIDLIITSPFVRTTETAHMVAEELGLSDEAVILDDRLGEINLGELNGKAVSAYRDFTPTIESKFEKTPEGGENLSDMKRRIGEFLYETEAKYRNTTILFVGHEYSAWMLDTVAAGGDASHAASLRGEEDDYIRTGEVRPLSFIPLPHNEEYELDLHRPFIDRVELISESGRPIARILEVVDCWVESGSMPFAQHHYLGASLPAFDPKGGLLKSRTGFPADFIAEYIAQTRTWFYYMHVMGVALFKSPAFTNVVTTGTVLAEDGAKLSKLKGNYTDPLVVMDRFGADAYRFYLMGSVVMQAEDLVFRDEDVCDVHNRVVGLLWNSYRFFTLYKQDHVLYDDTVSESTHVLDRWARSLLARLIGEVTEALDAYDTPHACRVMRQFVDDYSTWYVRRSRERAKGSDTDAAHTITTQHQVLTSLAKLIAPLMPFIAESIYRGIDGEKESVHLAEWPAAEEADAVLLEAMDEVRRIVSLALEARAKAGIKVRQPVATLKVKTKNEKLKTDEQLLQLIRDEVNVKEVVSDDSLERDVWLDTTLTKELKDEGAVRDLIRHIQDLRKKGGLSPGDSASLSVETDAAGEEIVRRFETEIKKTAGLASLTLEKTDTEPLHAGDHTFSLSLDR